VYICADTHKLNRIAGNHVSTPQGNVNACTIVCVCRSTDGRTVGGADPPPPAAPAGCRYAKCAHQTERAPEHYDNAGSHVHMCVHCGNKKISSPVCRQRNSCLHCCARVTKFNLCPQPRSSGLQTHTGLGFAKNSLGGQTKRLLDDLMVFGFALGASGRKNFMADADVRQSGFGPR
jgi:hypothetical protein